MTHAPIPLTELDTDEEGAVVELAGGGTFVSRLATLGFTPGAPLKMMQNFHNGPLIVLVRDTRIALGRGEARKVAVLRRQRNGNG
jgi:ferrous iron transport protein A